MVAGARLLLALAFFGCISVISAQVTGDGTCLAPTVSGTIGSIVITLNENDALTLKLAQQINITDLLFCGDDITLDEVPPGGGALKNRAMTFTLNVTTALPCGVKESGTPGEYTFTFVTKSLTDGYHSLDVQFSITCDFNATQLNLSNQTLVLMSVLNTTAVNRLVPDMTMTINWRDRGTSTWNPVAGGGEVGLTSELQIVITLDKTSSAAKEFGVTECEFTSMLDSVTRTAMIIDGLASDAAQICPTTDGKALDFNATEHGFTYNDTTATFTGETQAFDSFTLWRTPTSPPTYLKCTINYCVFGCRTDGSNCTTNDGARRKKRSVKDTFESRQLVATFTVTTTPGSNVQIVNTSADANKNVDTECEQPSNVPYLIGLAVLAVLLVFTVAVTVFMFIRMSRFNDKDVLKA